MNMEARADQTSTGIGVVFLDRMLDIRWSTPRAADLFDVIPSDELPELAARVLHDLRPLERDVQNREGRRYLVRLLPCRSLEDRIDGVIVTFVDVSDLHEANDAHRRTEAALQTSEARLYAALHAAPVMVLSVGDGGEITWGYFLGNAVRPGSIEALPMLTKEGAPAFAKQVHGARLARQSRRIELELSVDGQARTYDVRIEPTGTASATAVGFDITTSKEGEAALREADRRKDEFLATLSHELRNPLTPLKVALDVVRLAKDDPQKREHGLGIMERQVEQLSQLVDELLDLSRITQGKIELARVPLDPATIIEAALETTRPLIREQQHRLTVDLPQPAVQVLGDPHRLTQVMVNLVTNAVKYTPPGGSIAVSTAPDHDRRVLVIRVIDSGVGIPAEVLPRVFDIFVQSENGRSRARGGLGIGLSLVKRLVELHGGRVTAASEGTDKGTAVTVELPLLA